MSARGDVVSLFERRLERLVTPVIADGERFERELRAFLVRNGFAESYIEAAVPDLVEAYLNEDERPLWHQPYYQPPTD